MSEPSLDLTARAVLRHFPQVAPGTPLQSLGNHGGYSGARLWRVEAMGGSFCLRAWPAGGMTAERLRLLHEHLNQLHEAGVTFVPQVCFGPHGSGLEAGGRLWELTTWLPGRADFQERPTSARLEAACVALARVHMVWASHQVVQGPCPGIGRRLERARTWNEWVRSGGLSGLDREPDGSLRRWAERARQAVAGRIERVAELLVPWMGRTLPLHACLCDVWHDHVLFEGDRVVGLIDFGALKQDHAAVDLARLLGSLVGDDAAQWQIGLSTYGRVSRLTPEEAVLARVLDETGTVLAAATWMLWLYRDHKVFPDRAAVVGRIAQIVERLER